MRRGQEPPSLDSGVARQCTPTGVAESRTPDTFVAPTMIVPVIPQCVVCAVRVAAAVACYGKGELREG